MVSLVQMFLFSNLSNRARFLAWGRGEGGESESKSESESESGSESGSACEIEGVTIISTEHHTEGVCTILVLYKKYKFNMF